ncbi:MAG: ABC transporter substrate-binding protein [Catenulispora sp.]|nr:ABC transporter substrate-binding protein [Catenulispora sp.]
MLGNRSPRALTALVAALALLAAGCGGGSSKPAAGGRSGGGNAPAPGVTAITVTIGSHQPLTGPAAPGYSEIAPAAKAYFDYVNANGGIYGRQIVYKYLDDAYNPTTTNTVVRQLVLNDQVFALFNGLGTPTHTKVVDYLNSEKVPDLFVASGCQCWDQPSKHPYTFGFQTDYVREGKILGQYLEQKFPDKKFAYFYQNDDFGKDGVAGLDKYIPAGSVAARQSYEPGNTDISAQLTAIAQSKADVVVLFTIPAYTALFRLGMLKANYNPQLAVSNVGSDPTTLTGLLESFAKQSGATVQGSPLIQGIITDAYLPPPGGSTPDSWVTLFQKVHDKYIPTLPFDGNVEYGMAAAYTFTQVLKAAGQNPTRAALVKAVEAGGYSGPGLVPFAFSGASHAGYTGAQVGVVTGNTIALSGKPLTTDDGAGAINAYLAPQPTAPDNGIPTG